MACFLNPDPPQHFIRQRHVRLHLGDQSRYVIKTALGQRWRQEAQTYFLEPIFEPGQL